MAKRPPPAPAEGDGTDAPVVLPIDGVLDLHAFRPGEVGSLVPEWIRACRERGLLEVRIVHGKGSGALRRGVLALLDRDPGVLGHRTAGEGAGGWGATLVRLAPPDRPPVPPRGGPVTP